MFLAYLAARRLAPRYAVIVALLVGVAIALVQGLLHVDAVRLALARAGLGVAPLHGRRGDRGWPCPRSW